MKNLNFAPLVRLAELSWYDVDYILNNYRKNIANPVRPTLVDYSTLSPKITELLGRVPFSPPLYRINAEKEQLTVHLGIASAVAASLELDFSDTCIDVLYHRAMLDAHMRGSKMQDEWSIGNLRERSEVLNGIVDQFHVLREEPIHLEVQDQYMTYAFSLADDDDVMDYREFQESIAESCLNIIQNVLIVEQKLASTQLDAACR